jgi:hypothetical protein
MMRIGKWIEEVIDYIILCRDCWSWYTVVYGQDIVENKPIEQGQCLYCSKTT